MGHSGWCFEQVFTYVIWLRWILQYCEVPVQIVEVARHKYYIVQRAVIYRKTAYYVSGPVLYSMCRMCVVFGASKTPQFPQPRPPRTILRSCTWSHLATIQSSLTCLLVPIKSRSYHQLQTATAHSINYGCPIKIKKKKNPTLTSYHTQPTRALHAAPAPFQCTFSPPQLCSL